MPEAYPGAHRIFLFSICWIVLRNPEDEKERKEENEEEERQEKRGEGVERYEKKEVKETEINWPEL